MARNNKLKNAYFKLLHKKIRKQKSRCSRLTYRSMQRSQKRQQEIEKASAFITNISNYAFTDDQIIALSKGLGFIPTPADKPCKISLIRDNHNLKRTTRIRHHAAESQSPQQYLWSSKPSTTPISPGSILDRLFLNTGISSERT